MLRLVKGHAYRVHFTLRDPALVHVIEGQYRGTSDCYTQDGKGLHFDALQGDGPGGWVIPRPLVVKI